MRTRLFRPKEALMLIRSERNYKHSAPTELIDPLADYSARIPFRTSGGAAAGVNVASHIERRRPLRYKRRYVARSDIRLDIGHSITRDTRRLPRPSPASKCRHHDNLTLGTVTDAYTIRWTGRICCRLHQENSISGGGRKVRPIKSLETPTGLSELSND